MALSLMSAATPVVWSRLLLVSAGLRPTVFEGIRGATTFAPLAAPRSWSSQGKDSRDLIDPATEEVIASIAMADEADVDRAVQAVRGAFNTFGFPTKDERIALLQRILDIYNQSAEDLRPA